MTADLFVRDEGPRDGTPVMLLHSLFFDHSMFDDLISLLPKDWRCLRPDHLGQGRSGAHGDDDLGMDRLAAETSSLIDSRVGGRIHLVGSSMGAYVALRVAIERPDLVASCTLLGASATAESDRARFADLASALEVDGATAHAQTLLWTMFGDNVISEPSPAVLHWRARFAQLPRDVAAAVRGVAARHDVTPRLGDLAVPLLLICGEQDHAKPPQHMRDIADAVPGSRLVVLPGVGHTPAVECPDVVARELVDWVGATSRHDRNPPLVLNTELHEEAR